MSAESLAAAWLSEMWPTVPQYREGMPQKAPEKKPRKPREARSAPREECPICGVDFQSAYIVQHLLRRHPESVQKAGENGPAVAS